MKKYVIRSESWVTPNTFVFYQTDHIHKSVWCNNIEDAKHFNTYSEALFFASTYKNIQGKWEVVEYSFNPTNPIIDAYDRAMKGI